MINFLSFFFKKYYPSRYLIYVTASTVKYLCKVLYRPNTLPINIHYFGPSLHSAAGTNSPRT